MRNTITANGRTVTILPGGTALIQKAKHQPPGFFSSLAACLKSALPSARVPVLCSAVLLIGCAHHRNHTFAVPQPIHCTERTIGGQLVQVHCPPGYFDR